MTSFDKAMLGFVSTFLTSTLWPTLPNFSLIAFASLVLVVNYYFRLSAKLIGILFGFIWMSLVGHYYSNAINSSKYYSQSVLFQGEVLNLQRANSLGPQQNQASKLNLRISKFGNTSLSWYPFFLRPKIRVSWYKPTIQLYQGDKIQLLVKLKPASGLANEGSFNYKKWLVSQGIHATGYVKNSPSNKTLISTKTRRQTLVNHLEKTNIKYGRFIHALSYGDRRFLSKEDWELLQNTGTAHLFAISGMHLAIVFSGCVLLFKTVFLFFNMALNSSNTSFVVTRNLKIFSYIASLIACLIYANLAGYQIPVMRAWLTLCLIVLLIVTNRYWSKTSILLSMLGCIAVLFPLSILSLSFWFSLIAVCLIIVFIWRWPISLNASFGSKVFYAIKLQIFLCISTLPLTILFFNTLPFSALIANMMMIPVTTFLLLPLCLLGSLFTLFGIPNSILYWILDMSFEQVLFALQAIDSKSEYLVNYLLTKVFPNLTTKQLIHTLEQWLSLPMVYIFGVVVMLPPIIYKRFWVIGTAGILSLTLFTHQSSSLVNPTRWTFIAFDIGQGSAHLIQSGKTAFLYDTGMSNKNFSMAQNVLLPYFEHNNLTSLEYLFISHFDNDHSGGVQQIKQSIDIGKVLDPNNDCNREEFLTNHANTPNFMTMEKLKVEILWPLHKNTAESNNNSCVIKVSDEVHSILLTGDIEHKAEAELINHFKDTDILKSDVLVAPHHGSKTSSSEAFIDAVSPDYVVFSAGYRNRWDFPHQIVIERYLARGIQTYHTGNHGQLVFSFSTDNIPKIEVETYRQDIDPKWYNQVLVNLKE